MFYAGPVDLATDWRICLDVLRGCGVMLPGGDHRHQQPVQMTMEFHQHLSDLSIVIGIPKLAVVEILLSTITCRMDDEKSDL